ncbi:MAG: SusD/RagB family nutrient-binding outer membrane lipoprotein [Bacteroidales bacterium]|nr:SusD/RagB family nutrient-binding outer membrane lipoprotein [Bacteroidales bacterium]
MKAIKYTISATMILLVIFISACKNLDDMNINPNGVDPANAHPNLLIATVITYTGQNVVGLGFGDIAGVMQHTQKDGWSGSHDAYEWSDQDWSGYYGILRNTGEIIKKSKEMNLDFQEGVGLIMKAYNFGFVADLWGDAPYSKALLGELGGSNLKPVFDSQRDIYLGILGSLDSANTLLSKSQADYKEINPTQDVLFHGDVAQWQKFANSLALRYYMRISSKEEAIARAGIEKIASQPDKYPLMLEAGDDAGFPYIGNSSSDSWPCNTTYDISETNYRRIKMCSTLVEKLQTLNDPRLGVWARKIDIPLVIDPTKPDNFDEIIAGKRVIAQNVADTYVSNFNVPLDLDPEYVGLPPAWSIVPQAYNLCPNLEQAPLNPHASHISEIYKAASGPLLKARIMSAAEVNFILAEAALNGWSVNGTASEYYNSGVKASLDAWGLSNSYDSYIADPGAVYAGTLEQIMEQKWIASWTAAAEAWFDYRRTGFPALTAGPYAKRSVLPLRFYYGVSEMSFNPDNTQDAADKLETTSFTAPDGKNSPWSRPWALQGTGKPW